VTGHQQTQSVPRDIPGDLPLSMVETYVPTAISLARTPDLSLHVPSTTDLPHRTIGGAGGIDTGVETAPAAPVPIAGQESRAATKDFVLHRLVAMGGMGEVWSALQTSLERNVAVKRLLPKMFVGSADTVNGAIVEFRREARVAARLEHPNIVPIHDFGVDDQGRPLLAMKHVEGKTWVDEIQIDALELSPADFLAKHLPILVNVCHAVEFAHSRGVVHRDLKPGQVMVGAFGEVLLMDWGLAIAWKETHHGDAPALALPMPADASSPAGTPALMAPEQTERTAARVGPHTDVFLLGATLYFLLTLSYPYQAPSSQAAFLRAIAAEIDRPELRAPNRWIPKELADIAMTAVAPLIQDRFASVATLRSALVDWMTGAARRREAQTLLEGCAATLESTPNNYEAFDDVIHRLERARALWPDQPFIEAMYRDAKEGYARVALRSNDLTLARAQTAGLSPGPTRDKLLAQIDSAARALAVLKTQRRWAVRGIIGSLTLLVLAGGAFIWRLDIARRDAERERERANTARQDSESLVSYMVEHIGKKLQLLGRVHDMDDVLNKVDELLTRRTGEDMTQPERRSMINLLIKVSESQMLRGNMAKAEDAITRARSYAEELVEVEPDKSGVAVFLHETWDILGLIRMRQPDSNEARRVVEQALALSSEGMRRWPDDPRWREEYAVDLSRLAMLDENQGFTADASRRIIESLMHLEEGYRENPSDPASIMNLLTVRGQFARLKTAKGLLDEGLEEILSALAVAKKATESFPDNTQMSKYLSNTYGKVGNSYEAMNRVDDATLAYRQGVEICDKLLVVDPSNLETLSERRVLINGLARMLEKQGKHREALELFRESLEISERLVNIAPTNVDWLLGLGVSYNRVATSLAAQGDNQGAPEAFQQGADLLLKWVARDPHDVRARRDLFQARMNTGDQLEALGRFEEALQEYRQAIDGVRETLGLLPDDRVSQRNEPTALIYAADVLTILERPAEAHELFEQFLQTADELASHDLKNTESQTNRLLARQRILASYLELGDIQKARDLAAQIRAEFESRFTAEPKTWEYRWGKFLIEDGLLEKKLGNDELAKDRWREAVAALTPLSDTGHTGAMSAHATAAAYLGDVDEARRLVDKLNAKHHRNPLFWRTMEPFGLAPTPPTPYR